MHRCVGGRSVGWSPVVWFAGLLAGCIFGYLLRQIVTYRCLCPL